MGRKRNPIHTENQHQKQIASMLRDLLDAAGLTFEELAQRTEGISRVTLQRAASGNYLPKEKVIKAFAEGCGYPEAAEILLRMRTRARIDERRILPTLGPVPSVPLISDWRDLSRALEYLYEAAGAPSLREIRDKSGNPHALSLSSLRRIVLRITRPVDEQQLLAIVHGCGITDQDDLWSAAWTKVSSSGSIDLGPDLAVAMLERFQRGQNLASKAYAARAVTGRRRSVSAETPDEQSGGGDQRSVRQLQDRRFKIAKMTLPENEKRTAS
ncbi:helix-turn-helix domain-containing protein [Streptomyces sp. NPDC091217]|uniref:helix-turn-helix domain-containing protein n=1 Tax=Streptomyces sp. NPDC091217 TaxID=3365975 RepID=UPI003822727E